MIIKLCESCMPKRTEQLSKYYGVGPCDSCEASGQLCGFRLSTVLEKLETLAKYTKVETALPEEFVTVLVYYDTIVEYDIAQRELGEWVSAISGDTLGKSEQFPITHWKALDRPEPDE